MSHFYSSSTEEFGNTHCFEDTLFYGKLEHPRIFTRILKCIHFSEKCLCSISTRGLKFANFLSTSSNSSCFIPNQMFEVYRLVVDDIYCQINLTLLLEFLQIFGNSPSHVTLLIHYRKYVPLQLILEEQGVITECNISTDQPFELLDLNFGNNTTLCHFVMKPEGLKDIFNDLDMSNANLEVAIFPKNQILRFISKGTLGHSQIDINNHPDMVEKMIMCSTHENISFSYPLSILKNFFKALIYAMKSSIRINCVGMLCIQFILYSDSNKIGFSELLILPVENI